jgi:transcriptional regulator with GAF, ATPase, and Fis domain
MLDLEKWTRDRHSAGTLADVARRMYQANLTLMDASARLRNCYALEALMANEGIQTKAAQSLGCHRNQLRQMVKMLGITTQQIRLIARALKALRSKA